MADSTATFTFSALWNGTGIAPAGTVFVISVAEMASAGIEVTGTFTATLLVETTIDGITWFTPNCLTVAKAAGPTSFTAPGRTFVQLEGITVLRVRCSAYTSGSPVATAALSLAGV